MLNIQIYNNSVQISSQREIKQDAGLDLLAVLVAYLALLDRPRMMGLLANCMGAFLGMFFGSGTEAFRTEVVDSELRLEKPVRGAEASVSLGVVKELVLLRGSARRSNREGCRFTSWGARVPGIAGVPDSLALCQVRSVSGPSLSEASPRRARRSMDARVGRGADRELDRASACATVPPLRPALVGSSLCRGAALFFRTTEGRKPDSWSEVMESDQWRVPAPTPTVVKPESWLSSL